MKWLDRWILRQAQQIRERDGIEISYDKRASNRATTISGESHSLGDSSNRMNFTVYRAQGGTVVEINRYDRRKDQHHCDLHIVTADQDLGEALGKIVTYESLKV